MISIFLSASHFGFKKNLKRKKYLRNKFDVTNFLDTVQYQLEKTSEPMKTKVSFKYVRILKWECVWDSFLIQAEQHKNQLKFLAREFFTLLCR